MFAPLTPYYIHPTARIHETARIGYGAIIGRNVEIQARAVICPYAVIGGIPESGDFFNDADLERSCGVRVCAGAFIGEFTTVHAGTKGPTEIGGDARVFNHAHIAHDCYLHGSAIVGGHASLAGHTIVMRNAIVSGRCNVHQWSVIGPYAMLGAASYLKGHVPPGEKWMGNPARPSGLNDIGLERAQLTKASCDEKYLETFNCLKSGRNI